MAKKPFTDKRLCLSRKFYKKSKFMSSPYLAKNGSFNLKPGNPGKQGVNGGFVCFTYFRSLAAFPPTVTGAIFLPAQIFTE